MKDIHYLLSIISVIVSVILLQNNNLKRNINKNRHLNLIINTVFVIGILSLYNTNPLYLFLLSMIYLSFIYQ